MGILVEVDFGCFVSVIGGHGDVGEVGGAVVFQCMV